jgi:4'-phosphopantetheinyl transferase
MMTKYSYEIQINTLSPKPGVIVWYAKIPQIIRSIFRKGTYHNSRPMVNEIFQKHDFIFPVFSSEEIQQINAFKALKKQMEWISGRFLIKKLTRDVFFKNLRLDQISFFYLDKGAPVPANDPDIPVSLSHSHDYAAVAVCKNKGRSIGIDIEQIGPRPDRWFMNTAFTQAETASIPDCAEEIFRHWTIKEAFLKYIKQGFNESLHRVEVIDNRIWHNKNKIDVDIFSYKIDSRYIISIVSG